MGAPLPELGAEEALERVRAQSTLAELSSELRLSGICVAFGFRQGDAVLMR